MDRAISRWILIFLAQESGINSSVFKSLLSVLPLPEDDLLLKKLDILLRIRFQMDEECSIGEDILSWLEVVEELDTLMGVSCITDSLVQAYRAVAVECTARYLPGKVDQRSKYFGSLKRIWRGRIRLMEQTETDKRSGLLTDELILWRTRLEAALTEQSIRSEIMEMNVRTDAFRLLKAYLDEEVRGLLPLFVVDPVKNTSVRGSKGVDLNISPNHRSSPPHENLKRHAPYKAARVLRSKCSRGVRIVDADELEIEKSVSTDADTGKKKTLQATPLVNSPFADAQGVANLDGDVNTVEVHEILQSSNMVKGPISDPHTLTDSLASDKCQKSANLDQDVNVAPSVPHKSTYHLRGSRELPTYNVMNRHDTARTYEVEEPEDLLGQDQANPNTRPAKRHSRRRNLSWDPKDEEVLIAAVQKFGIGQWKFILNCYPDRFQGRTPNDLKDKWRNLTNHTLRKI